MDQKRLDLSKGREDVRPEVSVRNLGRTGTGRVRTDSATPSENERKDVGSVFRTGDGIREGLEKEGIEESSIRPVFFFLISQKRDWVRKDLSHPILLILRI